MKLSMIAAAGLLTLAAGTAFAVEPPAPPAPPAPPMAALPPLPPSALGATTRAEAEARAKARFAALDTDHDGFVTRAESRATQDRMIADAQGRARAGLGRYFEMMDADHNGSISRAEFDAFHAGTGRETAAADGGPARMMPPPPAGPEAHGRLRPQAIDAMMIGAMFDAMDANGDDRVSLAEAVDAARDHFDALDTNHDGTLSPDERRGGMRVMVMKRMGASPRQN